MIWALLFGLLFSIFGGGVPSIIHGGDKLIKTHVVDLDRQEKLLFMIHESEKEQQRLNNDYKSFAKEINRLFQTKNIDKTHFSLEINKLKCSNEKLVWMNTKLAMESRVLIYPNEWDKISEGYKFSLKTMDKVWEKDKINTLKHFSKLKEAVKKQVGATEKTEVINGKIKEVEGAILSFLEFYQKEIENEESLFYQYQIELSEVEELQRDHAVKFENLVNIYIELYYSISQKTNEKEWNKIKRVIKLPF